MNWNGFSEVPSESKLLGELRVTDWSESFGLNGVVLGWLVGAVVVRGGTLFPPRFPQHCWPCAWADHITCRFCFRQMWVCEKHITLTRLHIR